MSEAKKSNLKKHISAAIRICVAVVAVYLVLRKQDLAELGQDFLNMNWFVFFGACLLHLFCHCVFVFRWRLLLRTQEISIPYFAVLKLHLLGLFYNMFLPGAVGGDLLRAWYVTHHTEKKVAAALSVFVDRAIGLGCTVLMAGFCYWLIISGGGEGFEAFSKVSDSNMLGLAVLVFGVFFAIVLVFVVVLSLSEKGRGVMGRISSFIRAKGAKLAKKLLISGKLYCSKPLTLFFAVILTFFIQGLAIIAIWLVCRDQGIAVGVKYFLMFFPISWIIGSLPISIGGLGVMEGPLEMMFSRVPGILEGQAVKPGLIQRAIWYSTSIPGLIIQLKGAHLPADKDEFLVDSETELD
ncbi:MAG: flippase-like domain-containing protein [Planctomycetes bacterium]|nr:flippase-like domain-containing protein [Planctomycetota bacterium]